MVLFFLCCVVDFLFGVGMTDVFGIWEFGSVMILFICLC